MKHNNVQNSKYTVGKSCGVQMSKGNNGMKRNIQMCLYSNMQMRATLQRNKNDSLSINKVRLMR